MYWTRIVQRLNPDIESGAGATIVLGACGLLGASFVKHLTKSNIPFVAVDIGSLQNTENQNFIQADICSESDLHEVLEKASSLVGECTSVVNLTYPKSSRYGQSLNEVGYDAFCADLSLHLGGFFNVMKVFGGYFSKNQHGHIVSLASIYGVKSPDFSLYTDTNFTMPVQYAAIKAGVLNLSKYFASYYKADGVRFNCVSPGGVLNGQDEDFIGRYEAKCGPLGLLNSDSINGTLAYLISADAKYVNGQNIIIDDGFCL